VIQIHRSKPLAKVGRRSVALSQDEHKLLIMLGMMDNHVAPHDLLLDALCEGRTQIPDDRQLLSVKICRLRKKIGARRIKANRQHGYILQGSVEFVGLPAK
jgi:DNA-binding response OmpR family regulator